MTVEDIDFNVGLSLGICLEVRFSCIWILEAKSMKYQQKGGLYWGEFSYHVLVFVLPLIMCTILINNGHYSHHLTLPKYRYPSTIICYPIPGSLTFLYYFLPAISRMFSYIIGDNPHGSFYIHSLSCHFSFHDNHLELLEYPQTKCPSGCFCDFVHYRITVRIILPTLSFLTSWTRYKFLQS